jgi:hypothetical protein
MILVKMLTPQMSINIHNGVLLIMLVKPIQPRPAKPTKKPEELYGKLLYKDIDIFFREDPTKKIRAGVGYLIGSIILFILAVLIGIWDMFCLSIFFWSLGVILILFCMVALTTGPEQFKIYEKGIRFGNRAIKFLYFYEIDKVEEKRDSRTGKRYLEIGKKNGEMYTIGSSVLQTSNQYSSDYDKTARIILKRFEEANVSQLQEERMRGLFEVQWSPSARKRLKNFRFDKKSFMLKINEAVIKDGRDTVELSDIDRFIKSISYPQLMKSDLKTPVKKRKSKLKKVIALEIDENEPPRLLKEI